MRQRVAHTNSHCGFAAGFQIFQRLQVRLYGLDRMHSSMGLELVEQLGTRVHRDDRREAQPTQGDCLEARTASQIERGAARIV